MQPSIASGRVSPKLRVTGIAFVLVCLVVDFLPHHGPPEFRYTGSDPAIPVWNLGWPVALFIYDPKHGFQVDPLADLMLPFQFVVLAVGFIVVAVFRWLRNQPMKQINREALS
jgi:hypothetical protein